MPISDSQQHYYVSTAGNDACHHGGRRTIFKENMRRFLAGEPFLYVCDKGAGL